MKLTNCNSVYSSKISTNNVVKFGVYKKGLLNQDTISFCSNMPLARKINKYYRSGERHTLNRNNKLSEVEMTKNRGSCAGLPRTPAFCLSIIVIIKIFYL